MNTKSIVVSGQTVAYLEANASATKAIFFLHGNSGSSRTWAKQLADPLLNGYRMIAFDLPGHGDSFAAPDPDNDYSAPGMGKWMAEAMQLLSNGAEFLLVGFSLGTNVLGETLNHVTPRGIVLAASTAIGAGYTLDKATQPGADTSVLFSDGNSADRILAFAKTISFQPTEAEIQITIEDYNRVKPGFRPTLLQTAMAGKFSDEIALIKQTGLPVAVVSGKEDRFANPNYLTDAPFPLWQNKLFQLDEAGHAVHIDEATAFNKLLSDYAQDRWA